MIHESKFLPNSATHCLDIDHKFIHLSDTPSEYDIGKYPRSTASGIGWAAISEPVGTSDIYIVFGGVKDSNNYWEFKKTSYYTGRRFYFAGTQSLSVPGCIKVVAYMSSGYTGAVQLYDYTNNNVISEVSIINTSPQILTDCTLMNLPTNESILEVRGKSNNSNKKGYIHSLTICF